MKDRIARDRLAVKLFYTACCVFAGLFVVPLMLLVDSPDKWEHPDARGIATVYVLMIAVLLPIWVPFIRRTTTSFPRSPLEAVRAIWAVFAPIAAMFLVWIPLAIPVSYMFDSHGNDRFFAFMVALVGAALIVISTYHVAAEADAIPRWKTAREGTSKVHGKPLH